MGMSSLTHSAAPPFNSQTLCWFARCRETKLEPAMLGFDLGKNGFSSFQLANATLVCSLWGTEIGKGTKKGVDRHRKRCYNPGVKSRKAFDIKDGFKAIHTSWY